MPTPVYLTGAQGSGTSLASCLFPQGRRITEQASRLACESVAGNSRARVQPGTHEQIQGCDVRDHQQRHVEDRNRIRCAQFASQRRNADLDAMVVVDEYVHCSGDIEGNDERPEDGAESDRQQSQHRQNPGRQIAIGSEGCELGGQAGPDDTGDQKDESEKTETV